MNAGVKISFYYFDYDGKKHQVLKNDGKPYIVSPYDLIWDGDFYYLVGYCDNREEIRVFRVDRIKKQPELLSETMVVQPKDYSVTRYTQEVFRMFDTQEIVEVTLRCKNCVMKSIIDRFGSTIRTKAIDKERFQVKVKVCTGPTFYRWVFGFNGQIKIVDPADTVQTYREMLQKALEEN